MRGKIELAAIVALIASGCEPKHETPKGETPPIVAPVAKPAPAAAKPSGATHTDGAPAVETPRSIPANLARGKVDQLPFDAPIARGEKLASSAELLALGKTVFAKQCATCHGPKGEGDGPAAFAATPKPRNFTKGLFKLHSNENGMLPTDEDLFDTISRGMPGSAMPSFAHLESKERWALVEAVKDLTVTEIEDDDAKKEFRFFKEREVGKPLPSGDPLEATPEVLAIGKGVFLKLDCNKCHGPNGEADGPSAPGLKDDWGEPMWPRNFQDGHFRGGESVRAIATRVMTGLGGTPMAAFGGSQLTDKERWALGHFVASLRKGAPKPLAVTGPIAASRSTLPIPDDLRQPRFWIDVPVYEVALTGDGPKGARIAVQRDGANVALLVRWDDAIVGKDRAASPEDFLDTIEVSVKSGASSSDWAWKGELAKDGKAPFEEKGTAPALRGSGSWREGEWSVLFVHPAWTGSAELTIRIEDRSPAGKKESRSATFTVAMP
jgi:cytochrome c oxidase cbb3-type subunit 2